MKFNRGASASPSGLTITGRRTDEITFLENSDIVALLLINSDFGLLSLILPHSPESE
jgi:hypothetical protein